MTHRIWVHPDNIKANARDKGDRPVVMVNHGTPDFVRCSGVEIFDDSGKVVARVVYNNEESHGRVWIETDLNLLPIRPRP